MFPKYLASPLSLVPSKPLFLLTVLFKTFYIVFVIAILLLHVTTGTIRCEGPGN